MQQIREALDPLSAATHRDPYPYYARLVNERPLYWDEKLSSWVASGSREVEAVLRSPAVRVRPIQEPVPTQIDRSSTGAVFALFARTNDGSRHAGLRSHVDRMLASLQNCPFAEIAGDCGSTDLNGFVERFPAYAMAAMLGFAGSERAKLFSLIQDFTRALAPGASAEALRRGSTAADSLIALFSTVALDRDVASVAAGISLLFQSYQATHGLIANTLVALGARPDLLKRIRNDRTALAACVQETLRYDSPVQNTRRYLAQSADVAGASMRAGDSVLVLLAAANRDPEVNPEPHHFDPMRPAPRTFSLGTGEHTCPGASLAVMIASAGVRCVLESGYDVVRAAKRFTYLPSQNLRIPYFDAGPGD